MKTLIHQVQIINKNSDVFLLTNIGDNKNNNIGVESISFVRTKDDMSAECVIRLQSSFDLIGIEKYSGNEFILNYQLPQNTEQKYDSFDRYPTFNYTNEDLVYIQLAYNENEFDNKDIFFGFIKQVNVVDKNTIDIIVQNHAFFLKKIIYNFSKQKIGVKEVYKQIIDDLNSKIKKYYSNHLNISDSNLKKTIESFISVVYNKEMINVDYDIYNFRAQNATAIDILNNLQTNYLTKTNFIYLADGTTNLIAGLFNIFSIDQTRSISSSLRSYFDKDYLFKIYNLKYEDFGLDDDYIKKKTNEISSIDAPVVAYVKESSLSWQNSSNVNIKVNIKVINRKNEVTDKSYGDESGESVDMVYYEEKTDSQIKDIATEIIKKNKYTGYKKGSTLTVYGDTGIDIWNQFFCVDVMQNQDEGSNQYELIIQKYLPNSVQTTYSSKGYEKVVEFGILLNTNVREQIINNDSQLKGEGEFSKVEAIK